MKKKSYQAVTYNTQGDLEYSINYKKHSTSNSKIASTNQSLILHPIRHKTLQFQSNMKSQSKSQIMKPNYSSEHELKERKVSQQQVQSEQICYQFVSRRLRTVSKPKITFKPISRQSPDQKSQNDLTNTRFKQLLPNKISTKKSLTSEEKKQKLKLDKPIYTTSTKYLKLLDMIRKQSRSIFIKPSLLEL